MPPPEELPQVVVFSTLFPSSVQPGAGLFVRERMFRVGARLPLSVVVPTPWFPLQRLVHRWRPGFRPGAPREERQAGVQVSFPRFLSVPGLLKRLDGRLMALCAWPRMRALHREGGLDVIDAHFGYPEGYAATLLANWLRVRVTITMRGTEVRHARDPVLRPLLVRALMRADRVFAVSESLRSLALELGVPEERVRTVGNGVDCNRFHPIGRAEARAALSLPARAPVLVSVGGLCERKGFHRVIDTLPELSRRWPDLHLLVVGGPSTEGDWTARLQAQVRRLGLADRVRFTGSVSPQDLHRVLSTANVFVLATRNEGWANVFLEAIACGLPVVTTDVGGNAEVICRPELGMVVPFGDHAALTSALANALECDWDRVVLRRYAEANTWDSRVDVLEREFLSLSGKPGRRSPTTGSTLGVQKV